MQIRQSFEGLWGMSLNAHEEMLAENADADDSYLGAS